MERNLQRRRRHDKLGGFGIGKEGEEEELGFNVPKELEVEIMRRLPIKSLIRLRRVSKSWKSFIESNYFINMHLTAANNNDRLLAVSGRLINHEVHVLDKASLTKELCRFRENTSALSFIGTCNGLICIQATTDLNRHYSHSCTTQVYLWNPVRRKSQTIDCFTYTGPSASDFTNYGFGYDSRTSDYKVVKLKHHLLSKSCIYTLSTNSWKFIRSTPPSTCYPRPYTQDRAPLPFVNGATHWLADRRLGSSSTTHGVVISYDFSGEVFEEISLPCSSDKGSLVSYKSLLAFMVPHLDASVAPPGKLTFHLWVMREYGVAESWSKLYTIDSPNLNGLCSPVDLEFRGFGEDENQHVFRAEVTQPGGATTGLYFVKSCNSSRPTFTSSSARLLYHSRTAISFRPSLVSLDITMKVGDDEINCLEEQIRFLKAELQVLKEEKTSLDLQIKDGKVVPLVT